MSVKACDFIIQLLKKVSFYRKHKLNVADTDACRLTSTFFSNVTFSCLVQEKNTFKAVWTVIIVSFFQHFILFHRFWLRPELSNVFEINYNLWNSVLSDLLVIYNVKMWQVCHFFLRHVKTGVVLFCYQLPEEKFQRASILVSHFFYKTVWG